MLWYFYFVAAERSDSRAAFGFIKQMSFDVK